MLHTVFAMRIEMDGNIHECKNSRQSLQERLPGYSLSEQTNFKKTITNALLPIGQKIVSSANKKLGIQGRLPFNKNSGLKFRKFHVPNGTVHSGCTDPTQTSPRLGIVRVSRIQKSGTGDNNFVKWKGTFRSNQPKWADRSKWTTFKGGPIIFRSNRTETVRSIWFQTKISGILGWMESTPNVIETGSMGVTPRAALPLFKSCLRYKDIAQNREGTPI